MKKILCPACNKGRLTQVQNIVTELGGHAFIEKGERCSHCKKEFVPEQEGQKTIAAARKLGLWGTRQTSPKSSASHSRKT